MMVVARLGFWLYSMANGSEMIVDGCDLLSAMFMVRGGLISKLPDAVDEGLFKVSERLAQML